MFRFVSTFPRQLMRGYEAGALSFKPDCGVTFQRRTLPPVHEAKAWHYIYLLIFIKQAGTNRPFCHAKIKTLKHVPHSAVHNDVRREECSRG